MGTGVEHALRGLFDGGAVFVAEWLARKAGPEQICKALCTAQLFNVQLKGGDAFVGDAKNFKEINPKGLGLAVFVADVVPGFAKLQCPGFNFVPVKTHGVLTKRAWMVTEKISIMLCKTVMKMKFRLKVGASANGVKAGKRAPVFIR